ncbi:hypothetical protein GCM10007860_23040 [Chitiniphilus shinanonensis]|uniref:Scramblase family protein n=1 Tax=Chitiniphilus shinanonensis TaxID=553088 RepID=A0ABQ6BZL1_9NEIS|nr:hypothetical protein [Chitiniphilus shinanonensis]GLS05154.1 hypothetical protein GCM10007860_23040 [Chitiniphilus shinanonensis]
MPLNYPLQYSFKILAIAQQLAVRDARGQLLYYARRKLMKLKESVTLYADEAQTTPLYQIDADRIIDFSASYRITDRHGAVLGQLRRRGMRSLWRASYEIEVPGLGTLQVREANPWVRVADGLVEGIPVLGWFSGYLLHPQYDVRDRAGRLLTSLRKEPAFLEGRFALERHLPLDDAQELAISLALTMLLLLERDRG